MKQELSNSQNVCQNFQDDLDSIKKMLGVEENINTVNQAVYLALKKEYGSIGVLASKIGVTPQYLNLYFNGDKTRPQVIEPALEVLAEYKAAKARYDTHTVRRLLDILRTGSAATTTLSF